MKRRLQITAVCLAVCAVTWPLLAFPVTAFLFFAAGPTGFPVVALFFAAALHLAGRHARRRRWVPA